MNPPKKRKDEVMVASKIDVGLQIGTQPPPAMERERTLPTRPYAPNGWINR